MSKKKEVERKVDNKQDIILPLDYSFKGISIFEGLLREKQRVRGKEKETVVVEDEISFDDDDSDSFPHVCQTGSTALKANNNLLSVWSDFGLAIERLFVDPAINLRWLDLSFNDFTAIDKVLLTLPNLTVLYLHGNNIFSISDVDNLMGLRRLKSLTLHGNPVEVVTGYRNYIISCLLHLKTLDFSAVTKMDRATAQCWRKLLTPAKGAKKK